MVFVGGASEGYSSEELKRIHQANGFYKLQYYERKSIEEIKHSVHNMHYSDPETIRDHLAYLESLSRKINAILSSEEQEGVINWRLRNDATELRHLITQLTGLLNNYAAVS